jgi:tetratricopeptide (TPR) repeat protein/tRNA A-37 threonylcarbamoyl transferase component Bud32
MPLDPRRVKALFNAILDLSDPADRPAFLDRECGDEPELRRRLEELVAAHDRPASALERPLAVGRERAIAADDETAASGPAPVDGNATAAGSDLGPTASLHQEPSEPLIGTVIAGRYRIRQEIGEGGMGSVYLADQLQPVKRQVALKLIKAGLDTKTVLARFASERQALAVMDHPNIARVLDAGSTESGHPFFVMELVRGIPLTDYCDQHRLGLPEWLTLLRQICSAVQHAHQKGIIHRDLKPSNILVESHDGHPVPKVIDFGLAKATSGMPLGEHSLISAFGSVAGTPLYMAPEQASFSAIDVDTRADIYALGVILYELLAGSTPIRRDTLKKAAIDEVLRVIREDEPLTPSSRLSTSEALPSIAASRQSEPARLSRFVRGDLDWIVMKALSKERQRRYDSPMAMAQDIERFTHHEPVSAGPPTAAYRFRKFVRRNRGRVIAASLVLLALLAGIVGTTAGLLEARRQQQFAILEAGEKEKARRAEALQRQQAESRLAQIEKGNEVLAGIFAELDIRKVKEGDRPLEAVLAERLVKAAGQLEGESVGDPLAVAGLQVRLGEALWSLGFAAQAIPVLEKARATMGAGLGPDHEETLGITNSLAAGYLGAGKFDMAVSLLEEALRLGKARLGPDHHIVLTATSNLAGGYLNAGQLDRALPLYEEALRGTRARLGPDHHDTLSTMFGLALAYRDTGKLDRALPLYEEALRLCRARLGPDHPDTLLATNNLAGGYWSAHRLDRSIPLFEEALKLQEKKLGRDHPDTLLTIGNLAVNYQYAGRLEEALPLLEETLRLKSSKLGPDHPDTLSAMNNLAGGYNAVHRLDRSVPLLEEALKLQEKKLGRDHPDTLLTIGNLGWNYKDAGRLKEAVPLLEEVHQASRRIPTLRWAGTRLLDGYVKAGRSAEAAALARELLADTRPPAPQDGPQRADTLSRIGMALLQLKAFADAEPPLRECLAIREKAEPDDWKTFNTRSQLGGALLGQKKYAEAEPLLRQGYEGMKAREKTIPPIWAIRPLPEALARLIELYTATSRPDEVKRWKDEKAKRPDNPVPRPDAKKP